MVRPSMKIDEHRHRRRAGPARPAASTPPQISIETMKPYRPSRISARRPRRSARCAQYGAITTQTTADRLKATATQMSDEHVQAHLCSGRQLGLLEPRHRPRGRARARRSGRRLTGCHVYAARLHDYRFKQMEYTLPEEYKDENELERQRKIHDSLIAMGLQLISESYLDVMKAEGGGGRPRLRRRKMMDGKHYKALIEDTLASDYDLVVMGALGMGAVKDSQLGSVTERFVRKVTARHADRPQRTTRSRTRRAPSWSCLDGSPQSFHGLKLGIALGEGAATGRVQAVGRLRPLPALRDVQRHRGRAEREGVEDLPLQGAGAAARGDHRYRAGQDLPVAPGDRAQAGRRRRRRPRRSRCSTASASRRS